MYLIFFSSSSIAETGDPNDLLGVIISYSIRATLVLSGMGGELVVDLPFKLVHPKPGNITTAGQRQKILKSLGKKTHDIKYFQKLFS